MPRLPPCRASAPTLLRLPLLLLLLPLTAGCGPEPAPDPATGGAADGSPRHNLVIVLSDALRSSNLPFYGYDRDTAPHLSALAEEAVLFADHRANYSSTPRSVSQMQSGRLLPPLLMDHSFALAPVRAIEEDLLVLPRALADQGYDTAIVTSHPWFNERARILDHFAHQELVPAAPGEAYAPFEALAPRIEAVLGELEEPFLLYVHSMDTHGPFLSHPGFDRFAGDASHPPPFNAYDGEILYTDHWVGELLSSLETRGLARRTAFVFTSDHGEELGEMGPGYWNRSHGYTVRQAQLGVPLLVRPPAVEGSEGKARGAVIDAPTSHLDLAPTLLRLVSPGTDLSPWRIDGRDLSPWIAAAARGDGAPRSAPWESAEAQGHVTPSFTWRYWGLHGGALAFEAPYEIHYDQWQDRWSLLRTVRGSFNFPGSLEAGSPEAPPPGLEGRAAELGDLAGRLASLRRRALREHLDAPPAEGFRQAGSGERGLTAIPIGVPTAVVGAGEGALPGPVYERLPDDDRWAMDAAGLLEAAPEENPGPLTLSTPWIPGRWRVWLRLDGRRRGEGWQNRARLTLPGVTRQALPVDGARATEDGLLDLGTHTLGRLLVIELSEPRGGFAMNGFLLEPAEGTGSGEAPSLDGELEEQLRALGYVQ